MSKRIALFPVLLLALLVVAAAALTWMNFSQALPRSQWAQAAWSPDIDVIEQMIFHYSLLPRLAISLLVGAGLGLVGVLFQQVLRNPLAEPTTLGVATGAQLGITVTTLWAIPGAMASQFAALAGACVVGLIVFGVAWGKRLSPVTLILAGLVVSLYCGAINQLLVIFHHDQLQSMFLWSTGTLTQTDWGGVERLWPQLLGGVMLTLLLLRPLTLMGLDDGVARNLGLALSLARLAALSLAIVISALLVNAVGIIGFIGLFAPLLAKMLGTRRLLPRLMLASLIGALILWLSDQIILWLTRVWMEVSTGSVTALIGAPLLLWLLLRLRSISAPDMKVNDRVATERQHVLAFALAGGVLLRHFLAASLAPGHAVRVEPDGHHKVLVVVGAGLLLHHIAQLLLGILLDDLLQAGLVVGLGVLALGDEGQDEVLCHLHAAVEVEGGDEGFKGVRHDAGAGAAAAVLFAPAQTQVIAEIDLLSELEQCALADEAGADAGQIALGAVGIGVEQVVRRDDLQHAVAQKFQPLVVLDRGAALVGIAGMGQRNAQQRRIFECIVQDLLQFSGL